MLSRLSDIDKVSIFALGKRIEAELEASTISDLASKLSVPLMSENRNRAGLVGRITADTQKPMKADDPAQLEVAREMIKFLMDRSGAFSLNEQRASYAPWLKDYILQLKDSGTSYATISELTGISENSLTGFRSSAPDLLQKGEIDELSRRIAGIWTDAPPRYRKNLGAFRYFLDKKHSDVSISAKELRQILINLGIRYPRGPKIRNIGTQVKRPFSPHAIWEGDGKQIKITINGREYVFVWYAFVDQNTTLIVGSAIDKTESAASFLQALKDGRVKTGTFSIGVLIDNRLSDDDMTPIHDFCIEHNIVLVRTFPGNSKSNGNIENNFSLFESLVGPINLAGNSDQIARQVAALVIEIFTGLRNNSRRPRLHGKTPAEAATNAKRPENARDAIEGMARRLNGEITDSEFKWNLIEEARKHFGELSEASENKIKRQLGRYPVMDIIAAQAAYLAQIAKYPEKKYRSEYFMAILRHKRETIAKRTYNETYRASIAEYLFFGATYDKSSHEYASAIVDELSGLPEIKTPAERMLHLDALCWWMVGYSSKMSIKELWRLIVDLSEVNRAITLRWWQAINEYVSERIGSLLYIDYRAATTFHPRHKEPFAQVVLNH